MKKYIKSLLFFVVVSTVTCVARAENQSGVAETTTTTGEILTVTSQDYVDTLFAETHKAENITSGQFATKHLYVGSEAHTVAAGDDNRFDTLSIGVPEKEAAQGRVLVWVEE